MIRWVLYTSGAPVLESIRRDQNFDLAGFRSGVGARLFSGALLSDFTCIYTTTRGVSSTV